MSPVRKVQQHSANLDNLIKQLKAHHSAPILQGFGIATPQQVKEAIALGAADCNFRIGNGKNYREKLR